MGVFGKYVPDRLTDIPTLRMLIFRIGGNSFFNYCLTNFEKDNPMQVLAAGDRVFTHHPFSPYATDVTFQQMQNPMGNLQKSKNLLVANINYTATKLKCPSFHWVLPSVLIITVQVR